MSNPDDPQTTPTTSLSEMLGVNIVASYSRAQALADGVLVACDEPLAREAGFTVPLAFSAAVEALITEIPAKFAHEDERGRRWDVLWMARNAGLRNRDSSLAAFEVIVHTDNPPNRRHLHELLLQLGPGDLGEPVLTVMTRQDL